MKVIFCTSPHVRHPAVLQADFRDQPGLMYSFAPIGLLSLIGVLRQKADYEPLLFDLNAAINDRRASPAGDLYASAAEQICAEQPDVVGLMTECDSYHHVLQICAQIRRIRPRCTIVLGGPHASTTALPTLSRWECIDAVCIGEGEQTLVPLLEALRDRAARKPVRGALIRALSGQILDGGPRKLIDHLDLLPIPAFDAYSPTRGEEIFLEVGRGCPFACSFCSTAPYWERRHRVKSPERIVAEVKQATRLYGPRRFHFTHDLFTTDRRWALAVSDAIAALDHVPAWTCSARADRVDPELLRRMADGGCNAIYYGVESGSDRILSAIGKKIPWPVTREAMLNSKAAGIQPNAGLIIGFPEDDEDSVRKTFDAYTSLVELGAKPVHIFGFCPFNGAASFDASDSRGVQKHFLDIPLPTSLDVANRELVVSDPQLFSAYRRLASETLRRLTPGFIEGLDEFTPLVESCLLPSLILIKHEGSLLTVYQGWLKWIAECNDTLGNSRYRRYYGGPTEYAEYLQHRAQVSYNVRPDLVTYLSLLRQSFDGAGGPCITPLSMATYRSGASSPELLRARLEDGCAVVANHIGEVVESDWDLNGLLLWKPGLDIPQPCRRRCGYVLQRSHETGVHTLQVEPDVLDILRRLRERPADAASLWAERVLARESPTSVGIDGLIQTLVEAGAAGLIELQPEV